MALYTMGRRRVILLLVLTSILLITLDERGNAVIDRARDVFSLALEPFDAAARAVTQPVLDAWNGIANYDDLRRENEALRAEIAVQRGAEIEARAAILEFQELLTLNRLLGSGDYPTVTAQVQGARPSNFQYTIEIDRGSTDGIEVGMPVVNGTGLVGKISRVFPNSAIVLLVVDPEFSIGVKVLTASNDTAVTIAPRPLRPTESPIAESTTTTVPATTTTEASPGPLDPIDPTATTTTTTTTTLPPEGGGIVTTSTAPAASATTSTTAVEVIRETGTLSGQGLDEPLLLRFVDDSSSRGRVRIGSPVQTAGGLLSIAPPGIPIGEVTAVEQQLGTRALRVEVSLAAGDLSKLNFVQVLRYKPANSGD